MWDSFRSTTRTKQTVSFWLKSVNLAQWSEDCCEDLYEELVIEVRCDMINTSGSPPVAVTPKDYYREYSDNVSVSSKYCAMGSQMFLRQYFHPAVSLFLTLDCLWLFFAGEEFQLSQCQRSKRTCQDCQDCQDSAETSLIITLDTPSLISWHQHSVLSYQHFSPQHKQPNTCKGFALYFISSTIKLQNKEGVEAVEYPEKILCLALSGLCSCLDLDWLVKNGNRSFCKS